MSLKCQVILFFHFEKGKDASFKMQQTKPLSLVQKLRLKKIKSYDLKKVQIFKIKACIQINIFLLLAASRVASNREKVREIQKVRGNI